MWSRLGSLILMAGLAGCGGESPATAPVCSTLAGTWAIAADYGNGLVAQQQWTVTQQACDLHLTGNPSDLSGPLLSAASGSAADQRFWATWINTAGSCQYASSLEGTVNGGVLSGVLHWSRGPYGQGFCSGGLGDISITGRQ